MPLSYLLSPQLQGLLPSLTFCPHLDSYFAKKKRKTGRQHPHVPATGLQALAQPVPALRLLLSDSLSRSTNDTPSPSLLVCSIQKPGSHPRSSCSHSAPLPSNPQASPADCILRLYPRSVHCLSPPLTPPGSQPPPSLPHGSSS